MDNTLAYKHMEGPLEIPTESRLGKKKMVQYYFKLETDVLSWYSKSTDKKPKGTLALNTVTEIKLQGGLSVAINYRKDDAVDTFVVNCQTSKESEEWVACLTHNMVVSHAGISPVQDQQASQQKKPPTRHSLFAWGKGGTMSDSQQATMSTSFETKESQSQPHQLRPITTFYNNDRNSFFGNSRTGIRNTNAFLMSNHRKTQDIDSSNNNNSGSSTSKNEGNDNSWLKISASTGKTTTVVETEDEVDDFVIVSGNDESKSIKSPDNPPALQKSGDGDEARIGKMNASTGKATLFLDDDDDDFNNIPVISGKQAKFNSYFNSLTNIDDDDDESFLTKTTKKKEVKTNVEIDVTDDLKMGELKQKIIGEKIEAMKVPVIEKVVPEVKTNVIVEEEVEEEEEKKVEEKEKIVEEEKVKEKEEEKKEEEVRDVKPEPLKIETILIESESEEKTEIVEKKVEDKKEEKVKEKVEIVEEPKSDVIEEKKEEKEEKEEKIEIKEEIIEDEEEEVEEEKEKEVIPSKEDNVTIIEEKKEVKPEEIKMEKEKEENESVEKKEETEKEEEKDDEKEESESIEEVVETEIQPSEETLKELSEEFAKDFDCKK